MPHSQALTRLLELRRLQSGQKNYAARVSHAADDAHRPPLLRGFAAAARAVTDRHTDGHRTVQCLPNTRSA